MDRSVIFQLRNTLSRVRSAESLLDSMLQSAESGTNPDLLPLTMVISELGRSVVNLNAVVSNLAV